MLLKSKANSGDASPKSSSMKMSDEVGTKPNSVMTDEATAKATAVAVAKAKEVIRNGGTQAEAAAAAREVARRVLKDMMQASSSDGASMANQSQPVSSAWDPESNQSVGLRSDVKKGRPGELPPLVPRNAGARGKVGLLSKFRKKMKNSKEKKMKAVPEEKLTQQIGNDNETGTNTVIFEAIEDSRDEVEVMPSIENHEAAKVDETPFGSDDTDERDANVQSKTSTAGEDFVAGEEVAPPHLLSKSSSDSSGTYSTEYSMYDDMDSYDSERVHHPRATYYMNDRRGADDKDSVASDVNILDAMLNMDSFMDALDEALFPVGTKNESSEKKKKKSSSRANRTDYEDDQGNCSVWKLITCRGGCCAQDNHCDSSIGYSDIVAGGESIQSEAVDSGNRLSSNKNGVTSKSVARASTYNADPNVNVSESASASLNQKEDDDGMKHSKSVSWADSIMGRDYHAPDESISKNSTKLTSSAKESISGRVRSSGEPKHSKLNVVSPTSAAQTMKAIETSNEAEENGTITTNSCISSITNNVHNEDDGTVADDSISSKVKILFRNTMANNPLWGAAKAANQCYVPTGVVELANNPEPTAVVANTGNDDMPNWRDSVVDTVQTTARPVNGNVELSQPHTIQQQHAIHSPVQGYFPQQQSQYQNSVGFHPSNLSSHIPHGGGFQNNHVPVPHSLPRFSPMNSPHQGPPNYYETINGDGGQWQNQPLSARYNVGLQHPNIPSVLPRINSNLSVLSADDKRDRYAGMEQQPGSEQYDQSMINPSPYHSQFMGSSAIGGCYDNANAAHFGLTNQQGYQGTESRGPVGGGDIVYNVGNDNVDYPTNTMMYHGVDGQEMSPQPMGFNGVVGPNNVYAYHMQQQQQQQQQHQQQQMEPSRPQFGMENGQQQYMQSPLAYQ